MNLFLIFALVIPLWAHFPIALPSGELKRGQASEVQFSFGHPFEATRVDVAKPRAWLYPPAGEPQEISPNPRQESGAKAWSLSLTPQVRGDHILVVEGQPVQHGREKIRDWVKVVLPVGQVQRGWDRSLGLDLEVVPLSRPYGLVVGTSFRFTVQQKGKPLAGALVEVERLNSKAPSPLPPEAEITRVEKSDALGNAAATLDHAGWWIVSVTGPAHEGVHPRASLWVYVGSR
jgi:nickel transport protein